MPEEKFNAHNPLVSIIITSYNRGKLIGKAIESALAQDYPNLELIISDNCSTDNSPEVIRKYLSDKRIRYSRNETNIGMLPNFRKASYELATGEYFTYLSCDDRLSDPSFISSAIAMVVKYPNVVLVYGLGRMLAENGTVINESKERPFFVREFWEGQDVFFTSTKHGFLSWAACLIKKEALFHVKGMQKGYITSDIEANFKMLPEGNVCFIKKLGYEALGHVGNASDSYIAKDKIQLLECLEDIYEYVKKALPGKENQVKKWRNYFIGVTCYNTLNDFKKRDKAEFSILEKYIEENYKEEYIKFKKREKWKLFDFLYKLEIRMKHFSK